MRRVALLACLVLAPGCLVDIPEVENAKVAGTWTLTIANRENGCGFEDWNTAGEPLSADLTMTQEQGNVRATVEGVVLAYFLFGLGTANFDGTIDGQKLDISLESEKTVMGPGTCMYTMQVRAEARVVNMGTRQVLHDGRITYSPFTFKGANPDCKPLEGCRNVQVFSGMRKPAM